MTYSEKLKDPRWQVRRLEILKRDKATCRICQDKTKTLHVHHVRYANDIDPWDYPDVVLLTLCEKCHETFHEGNTTVALLCQREARISELRSENEWIKILRLEKAYLAGVQAVLMTNPKMLPLLQRVVEANAAHASDPKCPLAFERLLAAKLEYSKQIRKEVAIYEATNRN